MFLVGIAGGSGSGKTTFTKKILKHVTEAAVATASSVVLLNQDSYYLSTPPSRIKVHGEPNFDRPEAFDWELLREHLSILKGGGQVEVPHYDFKSNRRLEETTTVGPCAAILMEGIYTLWDAELRSLLDIKVYLHVDADIRFIRRLHRDVRERGRTLDGIIRQYYDTVRPMHHQFLETTRQYADLVVGEETDIAAEVLAARISEALRSASRAELD
jgi:uridine kinase